MLQYIRIFVKVQRNKNWRDNHKTVGSLFYTSKNRHLFIQTHSTYRSYIYNSIWNAGWLRDLQIICPEANKQKILIYLLRVTIALVNDIHMDGAKDYRTQRSLITNVTKQSLRVWDFYHKDIPVRLHFYIETVSCDQQDAYEGNEYTF